MHKSWLAILMLSLFACSSEPENGADQRATIGDLVKQYDELTGQQPVYTKEAVNQVLSNFQTASFKDLPPEYKAYTQSDGEHRSKLKNKTYYVLDDTDVLRYIVGKQRIHSLLPQDSMYRMNMDLLRNGEGGIRQFWLIDKRLLHKIIELQDALHEKGYNRDAFWIRFGFRHPLFNVQVGGAKHSRHMRGEAADLVIDDINRDGEYTDEDKQIVLDLVERKIIGDKGGVGRYPGTRTVHIDVRGRKARWNQQK